MQVDNEPCVLAGGRHASCMRMQSVQYGLVRACLMCEQVRLVPPATLWRTNGFLTCENCMFGISVLQRWIAVKPNVPAWVYTLLLAAAKPSGSWIR